jgi:sporulation protein YlmC with PRC-barrel domain
MESEDLVIAPREETADTAAPVVDYRHELISSRRVEGTPVYSRDGEKLGTIHSVMIGKRTGKVAYAVLSFGGVLGLRSRVHPVPWEALTYDVDLDGYAVDMSREQLARSPSMELDDTDRPIDREYQERVNSYWGTMPWWGL